MNELTEFTKYEMLNSPSDLFNFRVRIEDAIKLLRKYKEDLDTYMIGKMKEQGIREIASMLNGEEVKVYYAPEKKEKIKDVRVLQRMLVSDNQSEREMSLQALSGGQAAWKMGAVRVLQDTLGLDLIETTVQDKLEIKVLPLKMEKPR